MLWRVIRTPPGSETRACSHRGSLGTWEIQMFPCAWNPVKGAGQPMRCSPATGKGPLQPTRWAKAKEQARYQVRIAKSERTWDEHLEVLVDHITDGQCYISYWPVRWGSEAQATHCREGEAGHNVLPRGTTGGTPGPQTVSSQLW